jgi:hypothetical protein
VKWTGPTLNAGSSSAATETLELIYESVQELEELE